ncbi:MAG: hypothetical protein QF412_02860 [Planctomycetota bacterium]|jgi:hypothetical protein|nr:hypothetical protein [Planctomycetota bacterium]
MSRFPLLVAVALTTCAVTAQVSSTIPAALATHEGDSWHFMPLGNSNARFQHLYATSEIEIGTGKTLVGMNYRKEGYYRKIYLATKINTVIRLQETRFNTTTNIWPLDFTRALGAPTNPTKTVFKGTIELPTYFAPAVPYQDFGNDIARISFQTPYIYKGGNLLLDIANLDASKTNTATGHNVDRYYGGSTTSTLTSFRGQDCGLTIGITPSGCMPGGSLEQNSSGTAAAGLPSVLMVGTGPGQFLDLGKLLGKTGNGCWLAINPAVSIGGKMDAAGKMTTKIPLPKLEALAGVWASVQFFALDAKTPIIHGSAAGSRLITASGGRPTDSGYQYWYGSGDPLAASTVPSGQWNNRGQTLVLHHH